MEANNILSYFILNEPINRHTLYKQNNYPESIVILCNGNILYRYYSPNTIYNYDKIIIKSDIELITRSFLRDSLNKYKEIYYKNDNSIINYASNSINYWFKIDNYLIKLDTNYKYNDMLIFSRTIYYINMYKYYKRLFILVKITKPFIFIYNKYELLQNYKNLMLL